jgi:post-segregation antitoxin (ccd killing protein)
MRNLKYKKTVSITLPQNLIDKARDHHLNISRITQQALESIFDYLDHKEVKA